MTYLNNKLIEKLIIFLAFTLTIITVIPIATRDYHLNETYSQLINKELTCKPVLKEIKETIIIKDETKNIESSTEESKYTVSASTKTVSDNTLENESVSEDTGDIHRSVQGVSEEFYYYSSFSYNNKTHNVLLQEDLQKYLFEKSQNYDVDYELILAIIGCESGWDVNVKDVGNCIGLGMISSISLPALNREIGITDLYDPKQNIEAICYMMSSKIYTNNFNIAAALMSYNKGQAGAESYFNKGIYETNYTKKVLGFQTALKEEKQSSKEVIK